MGESTAEDASAGWNALAAGAWARARECFTAALADGDDPSALEGLSWAAWWLDDVEACLDARERAYRAFRRAGDARGAARMALWLGDDHLELRGAPVVAEGWLRRAATLVEGIDSCPEHGWLAILEAHAARARGDGSEARRLAGQARELGRRHGAVDLEMFALATEGVVLLAEGATTEGLRCLDEATTAALAGEYDNLAPAAWSCCLLMEACEQLRDFERAAQWCDRIDTFSRRLDARFLRGVCRAHYGVVLTWRGRWGAAESELVDAVDELSETGPTWRAEALVRLAELRRRQGRSAEAEELFAQAGEHPLALQGAAALCLERGDAATCRDLADRVLRRSAVEPPAARADALALLVRAEIALGEHATAAAHADELRAVADEVGTAPLGAAARLCEGRLASAAGDDERARDRFEDAVDLLGGAPVEQARARLELARALAQLEAVGAAEREARGALAELEPVDAEGADRARRLLDELGAPAEDPTVSPVLTARQVEVLRLVAEGCSNQEIADRLVLSTHTVHRHVANIHTRLGTSTRAAAVAEASRRQLL